MSEKTELQHCANCAAWLGTNDVDVDALTRERDEAVRERDELRAANEVIERIVGGDQCELWDMENAYRKFRGKAKEMHELLNAVYRISHSVSRQNSCYHVHESWRQEIVTLADSLTTDKAAQETKDGEG